MNHHIVDDCEFEAIARDIVFMIFEPGNDIRYGQDFRYLRGIPSGIPFTVQEHASGYMLRGPGYGDKDNYGNGALFVQANDIEPILLEHQEETYRMGKAIRHIVDDYSDDVDAAETVDLDESYLRAMAAVQVAETAWASACRAYVENPHDPAARGDLLFSGTRLHDKRQELRPVQEAYWRSIRVSLTEKRHEPVA